MSSQPHHQPLSITAPVPVPVHEDDRLAKLKRRIKEKRGPLMVAAMFLACAAHRSALNPPGGYWKHGRDAGTPVMANYENFRMLTSMAFFTSLALVVLLSCDRFYRTWEDVIGLLLLALFDVGCLVSAYVVAAGPIDQIDGLLYLLGTVIVLAFLFFGVPRAWRFASRCW
ncbi:hypothetical protein ACQJBY_069807 [Aegilops geniculata]